MIASTRTVNTAIAAQGASPSFHGSAVAILRLWACSAHALHTCSPRNHSQTCCWPHQSPSFHRPDPHFIQTLSQIIQYPAAPRPWPSLACCPLFRLWSLSRSENRRSIKPRNSSGARRTVQTIRPPAQRSIYERQPCSIKGGEQLRGGSRARVTRTRSWGVRHGKR